MPDGSSRRASLPLLAGTIRARTIRSRRSSAERRGPGALALCVAIPQATFSRMETTGPPKFLGDPCVRALFSDPGGTFAPSHAVRRCGLPLFEQRRLPRFGFFRGPIGWPVHSLSTPRRTDHSTTTQDSLPAAGQAFPGPLHGRQGPNERFQLSIASSLPKISLGASQSSPRKVDAVVQRLTHFLGKYS